MFLSRRVMVTGAAGAAACAAAVLFLRGRNRAAPERQDWMTVTVRPGEAGRVGAIAFSGRASPFDMLVDPVDGREVRPRRLFPNRADPFAINDRLELGENGWALEVPDRGRAGMAPAPQDRPWALNMIPFGVAADGVILDPSGPWYDGGEPDPNNPFDRACTGWEYEVTDPRIAARVGLADALGGHVQPSGMFHYHGYPRLMLERLRQREDAARHRPTAPIAGYSADGFPVTDYRLVGPGTGKALYFFSGYVLRPGGRVPQPHTNPALTPHGSHDGLYVQDYVHDPVAKQRTVEAVLAREGSYFELTAAALASGLAGYVLLDERNARAADERYDVPGYPAGTYHYVLTPDWPYIPRLFAFRPHASFAAIIPFSRRRALYTNCAPEAGAAHRWHEREPY